MCDRRCGAVGAGEPALRGSDRRSEISHRSVRQPAETDVALDMATEVTDAECARCCNGLCCCDYA